MPEALARIRREPTFSEPVRPTPRAARSTPPTAAPARKRRLWVPRTASAYAAIFMGLAMAAIAFNAVSLQKERHPAPLFAPEAPPAPAASTPVPETPAAAPAPVAAPPKPEAVSTPSAKPPDRSAAVQSSPPRKTDPIGEMLRSETAAEKAKTVAAAQRALVKLGYVLQVDGSLTQPTVEALHDFEKSHGLAPTSELSPRVIAKLNGATH